MALKILSAENFNTKLKATIQQTGRLGFTETTATQLHLNNKKFVKFAKDDENEDLYICLYGKKDVETFEVRTSGKYYYVPTTAFFNAMGLDYKKKTIIFDLLRTAGYDEAMGGEVYKMNKREILKKG